MLTTSTAQYLHPDYLQPLPTTLDAKKSPLALLAQTCSSIGKDMPSKPIIPPLEKKADEKHSPRRSPTSDENSRPTSAEKSKSSPSLDTKLKKERTAPKDIPPLVPITNKSSSKSPSLPSRSSSTDARHSPVSSARSSSQTVSASSHEHARVSGEHESVPRSSVHTIQSTGTVATARPLEHAAGLSAGSLLHPGYYPHLFGHVPLDPSALAANPAYAAGLSTHTLANLHAAASLKGAPTSPGGAAAFNPYVTYARVKTAAGGTNLVPICRDPYCTTCQMSLHTAQLSSSACTAACSECNHQKSLYGMPTSSATGLDKQLQSQLLTGLVPGYMPGLGLSSLYPHLAAPAGHQPSTPHVCNWVSGTEYCGKRFSSPEELLQHLRTHTSSSEAAQPHLAGLQTLSLPPTSLTQSPYAPPASISPNSLRRAYPTSLSPVSSARYHPYAKPSSLTGLTANSMPTLPLQALGAYYPPYAALYGSRLGPTVAP